MNSMYTVTLPWGGTITYYAFLMVFGALVAGIWTIYRGPDRGVGIFRSIVFALLAGILGVFLGRAVYCGVRYTQMFYDPRGEFVGFAPFIDPAMGGLNVIGVILGVLLAAFFAGLGAKNGALNLLDSASIPGVVLYIFARCVEPLSGMGFGDLVTDERFMRFPFALENSFGDFSLAVCWIEAALACLVLLVMIVVSFTAKKSGTLAGVGLALLCVTQILPESLRLDDVLFLFIFARVSQMGYAVILAGVLIAALIRCGRRGMKAGAIVLEIIILLLGVGVCVGAEFALDKTNWPDLYVYIGMGAALFIMGVMTVRRLLKGDRAVG